MSANPDWYPNDFNNLGEEFTLVSALAQMNQDSINNAIRFKLLGRNLLADIIDSQNLDVTANQFPIPFGEVGSANLLVLTPPSPPIPQPTIKLDPLDARSPDVVEGQGPIGQALRIVITALNDDLTIYGIVANSQEYWDLDPASGVPWTDYDPFLENGDINPDYNPLQEVLSIDSLPVTIPKDTWKAFFVRLNPREGTVPETEPFDTINVVYILSNATNIISDESEGDFVYNEVTAIPGYEGIDRRYFDRFIALRAYGRIIPLENPGSAQPDTRIFPVPGPYPADPLEPQPPEEGNLGTVGFLIGGFNALVAQNQDNTVYRFNFSSETLFRLPHLSDRREWCGAVGSQSQFYVAGGSRSLRSVPNNTIDRYDIPSGTMSRQGQTLSNSSDMISGAPAKNQGYLFGGDAISWMDGLTERYGTLNRIEKINFTNNSLSTVGTQLGQSKALFNCTTGNNKFVWIFGGGSRERTSISNDVFDHLPIVSIERFFVATEAVATIGAVMPSAGAMRNASCGNQKFIYIAGGNTRSPRARDTAPDNVSTNTISRFTIDSQSLVTIGTTLAQPKNSMCPMGGSKFIYYASGYGQDGATLGTTDIEKLSNLGDTDNETIITISRQLFARCNGGSGLSDYNAGH